MELFDLSGKTALITGASGGLGSRLSHTLSNAGARVILASRRITILEGLAKQLPNARAIQLDITNKLSIKTVLQDLEKSGEKIDVCVNCAGINKQTPIFDNTENDDFENILQTNTIGTWYVIKTVATHMHKFNIHGSIINIAVS